MLSVAELSCVRADHTLFSGVAFDLAPGECLHLEGGNGVGKTSLLRILAGFAPAAQGQVRWQGELLGSSACRLSQDLLYLGHQLALKEELNALENLQTGAAIASTPVSRDAALAALQRLGLDSRAALPVRVLSQGQKRRVALARLVIQPQPLWLLDEPFVALDGPAQQSVASFMEAHLARGGMVLFTSHQPVDFGGRGRSYRLGA
jgi:heme exporter protein A